ncbi:MAG: AtpZ/AtpI family protein [Nitrospirota bacterium]|nr:AtpZ/AtpI family protein [Nitrospirota bacterium]
MAFLSRKAVIAWGLSIQAALELIAGLLLGAFLDTKTGKSPLFFVLGLIAGLIAAVRDFVALAKLVQKEDDENG